MLLLLERLPLRCRVFGENRGMPMLQRAVHFLFNIEDGRAASVSRCALCLAAQLAEFPCEPKRSSYDGSCIHDHAFTQ